MAVLQDKFLLYYFLHYIVQYPLRGDTKLMVLSLAERAEKNQRASFTNFSAVQQGNHSHISVGFQCPAAECRVIGINNSKTILKRYKNLEVIVYHS